MRDVAAITLAAGSSSRLGRPKQLVAVEGRPLVRPAVDVAAEAGCRPMIVVVGRDRDACMTALVRTLAVVVDNPAWAIGMGSSLRAGFNALPAECEAAVLMLCDQPFVSADTLRRLAVAVEHDKLVAVAEYAGTVGPPVLVRGGMLSRLRAWPDADGAKRLWLDEPANVCRVPCPEAATDIDTEADVARLTQGPPRAT